MIRSPLFFAIEVLPFPILALFPLYFHPILTPLQPHGKMKAGYFMTPVWVSM